MHMSDSQHALDIFMTHLQEEPATRAPTAISFKGFSGIFNKN